VGSVLDSNEGCLLSSDDGAELVEIMGLNDCCLLGCTEILGAKVGSLDGANVGVAMGDAVSRGERADVGVNVNKAMGGLVGVADEGAIEGC
jgi:hypothetical protein